MRGELGTGSGKGAAFEGEVTGDTVGREQGAGSSEPFGALRIRFAEDGHGLGSGQREGDGVAGDGSRTVTGDDDADEVAGVGGGEGDGRHGFEGAGAAGAEGVSGVGQRELLTGEGRDEAAAADQAAGFEAAEDGDELAPGRDGGFAGDEVAEDDTVAAEEHAAGGFELGVAEDRGGGGVLAGGRIRRMHEESPAAGGGLGARGLAAETAAGIDEGAEAVEAVGGDEAGGNQLPESAVDFFGGRGEKADEIGGEHGSAIREAGAKAVGKIAESGGECGLGNLSP